MVPIYTVFDLLSYFFIRQSVYFATIRDVYQAASIISFFNLLLEYLGSSEHIRTIKLLRVTSTSAPFPFCCCSFNPSKHTLLLPGLKLGVLQYVLILYLTTLIALLLQFLGVFCKESWSIYFPQIHLILVQTVSSLIANLCLNFFFQAVKEELSRHQLILKDICINWALFFVTYQGHALAIAVFVGLIGPTDYLTADDISTAVQSVLMSMEFFFLSILQLKAFSAAEYTSITGNALSSPNNSFSYKQMPPYTTLEVLLDALNPFDTIMDLIYVINFIFKHMIMRRPEPAPPHHEVKRLSNLRSESDFVPMISNLDLGEINNNSRIIG
ncbi:5910_t:CDS:2 [Funneliformis geosporum]|uniref:5910_t:CDS:1 n=1 Tax=Funneliformis geosporum TaxID=1117311 RepID=A0A9W4SBS8_9GLOM|nr:5910_t:CDS:2 [Funneliformis geosporum]